MAVDRIVSPPKSHVEVLTPRTSESDLTWTRVFTEVITFGCSGYGALLSSGCHTEKKDPFGDACRENAP